MSREKKSSAENALLIGSSEPTICESLSEKED
jgi:hypothetical protein